MILGIVWAGWHLPMFWFSPIGLPSRNLGAIGMWTANLMGFSVLLSYAARRTSFSVPIAILLHATLNAGPAMGMAFVTAPPADLHAVENKAQMVRWAVVLIGAVTLAREGAHPLAASFEEKKVG
jgi:hypothetical protein